MNVFIIFLFFHVCSFMMEFVYQRMCYPTSFVGFFTSPFTQSSLICTKIREYSTLFDDLFVKGVLAIIVQVIKDKSFTIK